MADKSAIELSKGFSPDSIRSRDNYNRAGHGFQTGEVVYYNKTSLTWERSTWGYDDSSEALGVIFVKDEYRFDVVYRGAIALPDTILTTGPQEQILPNTIYFLSDTPGKLTRIPPPIDPLNPKVRKPILATLNSTNSGEINAIVVNYRGYVEDTNGCVAFIQNIIPVGTLELVPGGSKTQEDLDGWLLCDGSEYLIDEYPDLFRAIGYSYGTPSSTDKFKVPDFWGYPNSPQMGGRIAIGNIDGSSQSTAYGGNNDINILPDIAGVIDDGEGFSANGENLNRQSAYHANFYIRAKIVERYINIKTCNGAGGAIKNWMGNGALTIWQRGTEFYPDPSKSQTDHLADLNRYTADRWFRKVGYCPAGMGSTGSGQNAPSGYIGICNRKSFAKIDTTIPDALRKQYPQFYMEYQSYISGPGEDTSLEYCVLENRIPGVKTLAGETVCVSFWAKSDTPGSIYVNLKQHFGYDTASGLMGDSTNKGGVSAISDFAINLPNAKQVLEVLQRDSSAISSDNGEISEVPRPPGKYPTLVDPQTEDQQNSITDHVFIKNTLIPTNVKIEGRGSNAQSIVFDSFANKEAKRSIAITASIACVGGPTCNECKPYLQHITYDNKKIFTYPTLPTCKTTLRSDGNIQIPMGESETTVLMTLPLTEEQYAQVQAYSRGDMAFPISVIQNAALKAFTHIEENQNACRCSGIQSEEILNADGCFGNLTKPKNYDPAETLGICCIPVTGSIQVNGIDTPFLVHRREDNQTPHSCTALGGQFIPNTALEYFKKFGSTTCGISEDECSQYAKLDLTPQWKQYEIVFRIPSIDNKYVGNSGTDYLGFQIWTHLSNGYCKTLSGAEAPPRNRLGNNFGGTECSQNSLCESCVSLFTSPFSYSGVINFAQFQMQTGTEFTAFVQPDRIEELEYCQGFFESNSCVSRGDYFPNNEEDGFVYHVEAKRQKNCSTPRPIITGFRSQPVGLSGINILTDTITTKGFSVGADIVANDGPGVLKFSYEFDCDLYRPEELPYLNKQLEWKSVI